MNILKNAAWTNELKCTKEFLRYLCALDLSGDPRKICDDMYDELETCDVDVEEGAIQRCGSLPSKIKTKILSLIEFYYQNADNCVNTDSDEERRAILRALKIRAKEVEAYIGQLVLYAIIVLSLITAAAIFFSNEPIFLMIDGVICVSIIAFQLYLRLAEEKVLREWRIWDELQKTNEK